MNESQYSLNPVPFVGREDILSKIHQHFIDAQSPLAFTILGGHGMGKTALLQHYASLVDDSTIAIYIPLKLEPVQTESAVWLRLMETIHQVMATRTYMEGRLPSPSEEILEDELLFWAWFQDRFIVALLRIIRPHRRLVLVMDDLQLLTSILSDQHLQSFIDHLSQLLQMSKQILMVATLPLYAEELLITFRTIVQDSTFVVRLPYLTLEEVHQCIDRIGTGADESIIVTLYTLTGGHPGLLSDYLRYALSENPLTPFKDIQGSMKALQPQHDRFFQTLWTTLNNHEQTLLHAIADLHHQNDEVVIHFSMLEKWLLESDISLEPAIIRATTRSLEYQQLITQDEHGFRIIVRLFQAWIIRQRPTSQKAPSRPTQLRNRVVLAIGLVGLFILLMWLVVRIQQTPRTGVEFVYPAATVTLGN